MTLTQEPPFGLSALTRLTKDLKKVSYLGVLRFMPGLRPQKEKWIISGIRECLSKERCVPMQFLGTGAECRST